jgi:hypothetical protein
MTEPTKLPGRDFFTLEETAERWGLDIEELEHWARQNLLKTKVGTTGAGLSIKPLVTGISRAERDRFERENELGPLFAPKKPGGQDPRERRAMLNIIGALLQLVKSPRPNRNCNDDVINELMDNWPEKYGISPTNLKKKFAEAKKSLDEDS